MNKKKTSPQNEFCFHMNAYTQTVMFVEKKKKKTSPN